MSKQSGGRHVSQGIINQGRGTINFNGPAIVTVGTAREAPTVADQPRGSGSRDKWDLGVITVLTEEARAVSRMLARSGEYHIRELGDGLRLEEAVIKARSRRVRTVAVRTLDRGQLSAAISFGELRDHYAPRVTAMIGIAGGIHPSIKLGDVVVVLEVVEYDAQKETPAGPCRRGTSWRVPAAIRRRVSNFFSDSGEPSLITLVDPDGITRSFTIHAGVIGSGSTVLAAPESDIRAYLTAFNDKVLAVETENAGIARAFYEGAAADTDAGWIGIRGISDHADHTKDDSHHEIASWHAAEALQRLATYLVPGTGE